RRRTRALNCPDSRTNVSALTTGQGARSVLVDLSSEARVLRSKSPNARAVISAARPNHDLGIPRSIIHGINRLPFAVVVVALFLALASVTYWPILFGRIPLPV